jgi:5-methylcytosine-specific restriction endonuclease McrA
VSRRRSRRRQVGPPRPQIRHRNRYGPFGNSDAELAQRRSWRRVQLAEDPSCDYCDAALTQETSTVDHVVPLAKGGREEPTNYALCCKPCNCLKADRTLEASGLTLRRVRCPKKDPRSW